MSDGSEPPSTIRRALTAIRAELSLLAKAFFRTLGATMLLAAIAVMALATKGSIADGKTAGDIAWLIPVALGYGAFVGFWPGIVAGSARVSWLMAGAWILVPLVLVPFAVGSCFWLFSGFLGSLGHDLWDALKAAGAEHEWLVAELGPAARAGPIALVFAAPLLVLDLGALALDPGVLLALLLLFLGTSAVFLLGFLPSAFVSSFALLAAYARRLRRRHG